MLISCRKLKKSFGGMVVLDSIDLDICPGDRIGIVGRNGSGKTTLANIITGCLEYDGGSVITTRQTMNTGYLKQHNLEPHFFINTSNSKEEQGEFRRLTSYLGIKQISEWSDERLKSLSGGEKTKLALAEVWASQPDLVVLDEPTNHMDFSGISYLIAELSIFKGAAVIISHDRYFLDQTVSQIAEMENGRIRLYKGNYSSYWQARQKEREDQLHLYQSSQKEQRKVSAAIKQLKSWSDKAHRESREKGEGIGGKEYYRKKAKKRDQAVKSQLKRLQRMQEQQIERPLTELPANFNIYTSDKGAGRLLAAEDIAKAYGRLTLFKDSSFYIKRGEKVGLIGPNGCGKTTLVKTILGEEKLDSGRLYLSQTARIAYVGQELPQGEKECFKDLVKDKTAEEQKRIFQLMAGLGIPYDRLNTVLGDLSRGERMKIAIGMAVMNENDLLILDEPTNHLDLFSRQALEESLVEISGTLLVISHDRFFLQQVCDHLLIFDQQKIMRFSGRIEDYLNQKEADKIRVDNTAEEELLLLETKISRVLSDISRYKPGDADYAVLDREYAMLIQQRQKLKMNLPAK